MLDFAQKAFANAILERVAALLDERLEVPNRPILTTAEAARFSGHGSYNAFNRWCLRMGVSSVSYGRFSRRHLELAMEREAKGSGSVGGKRRTQRAV